MTQLLASPRIQPVFQVEHGVNLARINRFGGFVHGRLYSGRCLSLTNPSPPSASTEATAFGHSRTRKRLATHLKSANTHQRHTSLDLLTSGHSFSSQQDETYAPEAHANTTPSDTDLRRSSSSPGPSRALGFSPRPKPVVVKMSPRGRHLASSSAAAHNTERTGQVTSPRNCSPPRPFTSMDDRSSRDQSASESIQRPASGTRIYIKREIMNQLPFESDMQQLSNDIQPETDRIQLSVEPLSEEFLKSKSFQRRLEIQNQFKAESEQSARESVQARRLRNNPLPDRESAYPNHQAIRMDSAEPTTIQDIKESFYSRFTKLSSNNNSAVSGSLTARTDPGPSTDRLPHLTRDRSNDDKRPGSRGNSRGSSRKSKRVISELEGSSSPNPTFLTKAQQAEVARILQENSLISTHKLLPSAHVAQLQKQQAHMRTGDPVQRALETRIARTEEIHRVHSGNGNGNGNRNGRRDERDVLGNCFGHRASPEMERLIIYHIQTYFPSWITSENRCQIHRKLNPSVFHVITLGKSAPTSVCCQCPVLLQLDLQTEGRVLCMSERCRNPTVAQYPLPRDLKIALWGLWAAKDQKQVESSVTEVAEPIYSNSNIYSTSASAAALAVGAHRSVETQLSDDRDDFVENRVRCQSVASVVKNREFRSESSQCGTDTSPADDRTEKVERAPFGSSLRAISRVNQYQNLELDPDSTLDLTALKSNNNFDARIASKEEIDKRNRLEKRPNHETRSYSPDRDRDRSPIDDPGPSYWSKLEPPPVHLSMAELRRMEENGQTNDRIQPAEMIPRAESRAGSRADSRIGFRRPASQAAQNREVGSGRSSVLGHHEPPVRTSSALDSRAASSLSFNAPDGGQASLPSIQHELGALVHSLRQRRAEEQARADSAVEPDIPEDEGDEDSRSGSPIPRPVSRIGHSTSGPHPPSIPANRIGQALTNQTITHRIPTGQPTDSHMNQLEPTAVHTPLAYRHTRVAPPQNLTVNNVAASDRNAIIERVVAGDKLIQQMVPLLPADAGMEQITQQLDVSTLSSLIQKARVEG
eukprot:GILJ01008847.1.p1 GENE.GILJ01008847.1~~GILJ01008847.1.p1  ORF type:complete len:1043 (-),score=152.97 GILJ01008847.1:166-3294(-)